MDDKLPVKVAKVASLEKVVYILEMQQYINISSYRDTLGSDTVSIHIYCRSYRYIEYRDISMYRHQNVYFYIQLML